MNRALPASVVVHLVFLLLVLIYGAWVETPVLTLPRTISVSIQSLPRPPQIQREDFPVLEGFPEGDPFRGVLARIR